MLSVRYSFDIESVWIKGEDNLVPDTISRLHSRNHRLLLFSLIGCYSVFALYLFLLELPYHMSYKSLLIFYRDQK